MVAAEERFTALQSDMEAKSGQPNPLERHVEELESMLAAMQAERDALLSENTFLQQADVQRISAIADLREAIEEQNCSRQLLQEELEKALVSGVPSSMLLDISAFVRGKFGGTVRSTRGARAGQERARHDRDFVADTSDASQSVQCHD